MIVGLRLIKDIDFHRVNPEDHVLYPTLYKLKRAGAQYFERRRLRGQQTFFGIFSLISPNFVLWIMPIAPDRGGYLLATKLREGPASAKTLLKVISSLEHLGKSQVSDHEHRTIVQSIAQRILALHPGRMKEKILERIQAKSIKVLPIGLAQNEHREVIYKPYVLEVAPFNILHADHVYRRPHKLRYNVGAGEILSLPDCTTVINSDIIKSRESCYVDINQWRGSKDHNLINDEKLLAIDISKRQAIISVSSVAPINYEEANWLGSPMLASWGHFVYEGLLRLELLDRNKSMQSPTIISSNVPDEFKRLASVIFPNVIFQSHEPGQLIKARMLRVAPLRSFHPHNLHFTRTGENLRLNGEPELFEALRKRVRGVVSNMEDTPKRVFLDRAQAKYRITRNQERMRSIAIDNGYAVIDPGNLEPVEQLSLFLQVETLWGQTGSGFFLAPLAKKGTDILMIGSDFSHDWAGLAEALSSSTGKKIDLITGKRDFVSRGFSEGLYHQDFWLSELAWSKIGRWCETH